MARTFTHAVTGRSLRVADGSRTERLVEADDNWTEDKPKRTKEASDGTGDSAGRGSVAREKSDNGGDKPRRRSSRKG